MAIPPATQTVAMIAGTVLAATGLNLGVLALDDPEPSPEVAFEEAAGTEPEGLTQVAEVEPSAATTVAAPSAPTETQPDAPPPALPSPGRMAAADDNGQDPGDDEDDRQPDDPGDGDEHDRQPDDPGDGDEGGMAPVEPPTTTGRPTTTGVPTTPAPPTTAAPPPTEPPATEAPVTTPAVQTEYLTYDFSGVAEIVIALHDGERLEFWSASPEPGRVYRVDDDGPDKVKITFQRLSDGEESEFEITFDDDGDLDVKQES